MLIMCYKNIIIYKTEMKYIFLCSSFIYIYIYKEMINQI